MGEPLRRALRLYQQVSEHDTLEWAWVTARLGAAGTYWVVVPSAPTAHPHPRPVWGVWADDRLCLSIGSPVIARSVAPGLRVTVHLDSGTDVVIVEGVVAGTTTDADVVADYDAKYDWRYDTGEYGPLTVVAPTDVLAWRSAGWAGRDGFAQTGRWTFPPPEPAPAAPPPSPSPSA